MRACSSAVHHSKLYPAVPSTNCCARVSKAEASCALCVSSSTCSSARNCASVHCRFTSACSSSLRFDGQRSFCGAVAHMRDEHKQWSVTMTTASARQSLHVYSSLNQVAGSGVYNAIRLFPIMNKFRKVHIKEGKPDAENTAFFVKWLHGTISCQMIFVFSAPPLAVNMNMTENAAPPLIKNCTGSRPHAKCCGVRVHNCKYDYDNSNPCGFLVDFRLMTT